MPTSVYAACQTLICTKSRKREVRLDKKYKKVIQILSISRNNKNRQIIFNRQVFYLLCKYNKKENIFNFIQLRFFHS